MFRHPVLQARVTVLLLRRDLVPVVRARRRILVQHLGNYLAMGLPCAARAELLCSNYRFLLDRVRRGFFRTIVDSGIPLWQCDAEGQRCEIRMSFSGGAQREGDLSLGFHFDTARIYTLSFAIGPGSLAAIPAEHALYIGRMQGKGLGLNAIRTATRTCGDIAPAALLLAAAEGIAKALRIDHIVGISAESQTCGSQGDGPRGLLPAYDDFWLAKGGRKVNAQMYHLPVPLPEKPLDLVKRNHRARTLRKRAFKAELRQHVVEAFRERALRPGLIEEQALPA